MGRPLGPAVFRIASAALGIIGLVRGDFTVVWHPVPDNIPARAALAYASSFLLLTGGLAVLVQPFRATGGLLLAILYPSLGFQWLVRVVSFPEMIGTWVGFAETCALGLGGVMIALHATNTRRLPVLTCRILFGLLQLAFGLGHFLSLKETVAMTPAWLPPDQEFWALATGGVHLLGGAAFILGLWPKAAAASLGLCSPFLRCLSGCPPSSQHRRSRYR